MTDIAVRRLANQGFYSELLHSPPQVAAWLVGIQAQDYTGAKWSIGLRQPGVYERMVEEALADQAIVRTWAMRGTLHLVAAADVHWLLAILAPRVLAGNARRYRQLELDEDTLARSSEILARALADGRSLDRAALREILENEGISTEGQRLFYMLQRAALEGLICQESAPKNKPLYRNLDQPVDADRVIDRQEAVGELALRYFISRGPATLDDFVWWSGLLTAEAKGGLEAAKPKLVPERIADKIYWQAEPALSMPDSLPEAVLLPGFDEYLVSYRDRSAAIPPAYAAAWAKSKAMFAPSILIRGQVTGLWKRAIKKDYVAITFDLFRDLTAGEENSLSEAARDYGRFLGKAVKLEYAPGAAIK